MYSDWGREEAFWFTYWTDSNSTWEGDEDLTTVYKSGATWTQKHWENFNTSGREVVTVTASCEWPDEARVGVAGGIGPPKISHLRDGGRSKIDITGSLSSVSEVRAIAVMPFSRNRIWAGTDLVVFQTTDGGVTWSPFMEGWPIGHCAELHFLVWGRYGLGPCLPDRRRGPGRRAGWRDHRHAFGMLPEVLHGERRVDQLHLDWWPAKSIPRTPL